MPMQRLDFPACSEMPELDQLTVREYFELLAGMEMREKTRLLVLARRIEGRRRSEVAAKSDQGD